MKEEAIKTEAEIADVAKFFLESFCAARWLQFRFRDWL